MTILVAGDQDATENQDEQLIEIPEELQYKATEEDEERFFLMYHMAFQPSEADALNPPYRKWLIMRFVTQKKLEQEAMERQRLISQIGPNLTVK